MHHASVGVEVKFRDFAVLSRWVGEHIANTEGFRVSHVEWALHRERRDAAAPGGPHPGRPTTPSHARSSMPTRSDSATIRPVAIADAGMLGVQLNPAGGQAPPSCGPRQRPEAPDVELVPEHIEVAAAVDARFVVGDA